MKNKQPPTSQSEQPKPLGGARVKIAVLPPDVQKFYGDPTQPEKRSFAKVTEAVEADAKWLMALINQNDPVAAKTLVEIGIYVASCVEKVVEHNLALARKVAERRT